MQFEKPKVPATYVIVRDVPSQKSKSMTIYGTNRDELFNRIKSLLAGEKKAQERRAS